MVNDRKGQAKHEIDVIALDKKAGRTVVGVLGEAKATDTRRSVADLERLERLRGLLAEHGHGAASAVLLVDLPSLLGNEEPVVAPRLWKSRVMRNNGKARTTSWCQKNDASRTKGLGGDG
ncbi:hypothetical protein [Nonomuraea gerenzanensis]|uniref:hypothetical protein n=1 Tax=Nonomuraea gerenzanensis TaxID=93944 RepID=UPI001CDA14B2|nr:hypothetical protein [Nonomuraea gerenzanensis]UBU12286.1 hypothetical protein LCN96_49730 [Nonomuraea gerenzanensis]